MTEGMQQYLEQANVTDIDPAPHLRLMGYEKHNTQLTKKHNQLRRSTKHMRNMEIEIKQAKPRAELLMLETKKFLRFSSDLQMQVTGQNQKSRSFHDNVSRLQREVDSLVGELRSYATAGTPRINVKLALRECR